VLRVHRVSRAIPKRIRESDLCKRLSLSFSLSLCRAHVACRLRRRATFRVFASIRARRSLSIDDPRYEFRRCDGSPRNSLARPAEESRGFFSQRPLRRGVISIMPARPSSLCAIFTTGMPWPPARPALLMPGIAAHYSSGCKAGEIER